MWPCSRRTNTAIYYIVGDDIARLEASPHLEGFLARGVEVLLLADPIDSFLGYVRRVFEGKPFKSVTQGAADWRSSPASTPSRSRRRRPGNTVKTFLTFIKDALGEEVAEVRASDRLTDSAVCLVAPEFGPDRQLEKLLAGAGRLTSVSKPILEVNPRHELVVALAALGEDERAFKEDAARLLFDEGRACSTGIARPTPARSPSGWPGCSGAAFPNTTLETRVTQSPGFLLLSRFATDGAANSVCLPLP